MKFKVLTKEEIEQMQKPKEFSPPKPGDYDFKVIDVEEKESKNGNAMIVVSLQLVDEYGKDIYRIKDWILPEHQTMSWKFKHFCEAIGFLNFYNSGEFDIREVMFMKGTLRLVEDKKSTEFPLKILDYLLEANLKQINPGQLMQNAADDPEVELIDDDVPF